MEELHQPGKEQMEPEAGQAHQQQGDLLLQATPGPHPSLSVFARRLSPEKRAVDESWLQQVLATAEGGEMLKRVIAPHSTDHNEREALHVLGIEKSVPNIGSIDVLYVTGSGRPVLVETKLARNPQKRREVIAQVAEYALGLRSLAANDLVTDAEADEELSELIPAIEANLAAGKIDLVVVGDEIDYRALALGHYLINSDPTNQMSIWFVEIGIYQADALGNQWILVPSLRQASVAEVRQTIAVSVRVESERTADVEVKVEQAQPEPERTPKRGPKLTEDQLIQGIRQARGSKAAEAARKLLEKAHDLNMHIGMRPKSASIRLIAPNNTSVKLTVFVMTLEGTFYVGWLDRWSESAGLPEALAERYYQRLSGVFQRSPEGLAAQPDAGIPLEEVANNLEEVLTIFETTVKEMRQAAPEVRPAED